MYAQEPSRFGATTRHPPPCGESARCWQATEWNRAAASADDRRGRTECWCASARPWPASCRGWPARRACRCRRSKEPPSGTVARRTREAIGIGQHGVDDDRIEPLGRSWIRAITSRALAASQTRNEPPASSLSASARSRDQHNTPSRRAWAYRRSRSHRTCARGCDPSVRYGRIARCPLIEALSRPGSAQVFTLVGESRPINPEPVSDH